MKHVVVIGAGPAGVVCAAYLLKNGIKVTVLEKSVFPRLAVGESLLPVSMDHFEEVGLIDVIKTGGFEIKRGARFIGKEGQLVFEFEDQHSESWGWTWQVQRAEFDMILANCINERGAQMEFGVEVLSISAGAQWNVQYAKNGENVELLADHVIDASGFGSVLPTQLSLQVRQDIFPNWAVFSHAASSIGGRHPSDDRISVEILENDLWLWIIPFSNGTYSVGFSGHKRHFENESEHLEYFRSLFDRSEKFKKRFQETEFLFEPKWHKGYSRSVAQLSDPKWTIIGNAAEFLDPIFSSGIALATASAKRAAELLVQQFKGEAVDWKTAYDDYIREGVAVFKFYVDAWYDGRLQKIFMAERIEPSIKRKICSVLAGHVWDKSNPFVRRPEQGLNALYKVVSLS